MIDAKTRELGAPSTACWCARPRGAEGIPAMTNPTKLEDRETWGRSDLFARSHVCLNVSYKRLKLYRSVPNPGACVKCPFEKSLRVVCRVDTSLLGGLSSTAVEIRR